VSRGTEETNTGEIGWTFVSTVDDDHTTVTDKVSKQRDQDDDFSKLDIDITQKMSDANLTIQIAECEEQQLADSITVQCIESGALSRSADDQNDNLYMQDNKSASNHTTAAEKASEQRDQDDAISEELVDDAQKLVCSVTQPEEQTPFAQRQSSENGLFLGTTCKEEPISLSMDRTDSQPADAPTEQPISFNNIGDLQPASPTIQIIVPVTPDHIADDHGDVLSAQGNQSISDHTTVTDKVSIDQDTDFKKMIAGNKSLSNQTTEKAGEQRDQCNAISEELLDAQQPVCSVTEPEEQPPLAQHVDLSEVSKQIDKDHDVGKSDLVISDANLSHCKDVIDISPPEQPTSLDNIGDLQPASPTIQFIEPKSAPDHATTGKVSKQRDTGSCCFCHLFPKKLN